MTLTPGTRLGPYEILARIGEGGMGVVYRARDPRLDRQVAIKLLPADMAADPRARERLRREAMAVAALDHPYICKIFEIGEDGDALFLVMEYIAGKTLHQRLLEGRMPMPEALHVAGEIAEALQEAHAAGFLHRDLKPANIMLTQQGHVKVMDFGLAKRVEDMPSPDSATRDGGAQLTAHGTIVGTPDYMSPEQVKGATLDVRSDLFSFGVMLAEMMSGRHPFRKPSMMETFSAVLREPPALGGDIPRAVTVVLQRLLAKDAEDRYASIADVRADLAAVGRGVRGGRRADSRDRLARGMEPAALGALAIMVVGRRRICSRVPDALRPTSRAPESARLRRHSIDCRASARQLLGRSQSGLFRRRHDRRTDGRSGDDQPAARDLARLGDAVQGQTPAAHAGDRQNPQRGRGRRRIGACESATRCGSRRSSSTRGRTSICGPGASSAARAMCWRSRMNWRRPSRARSTCS